MDFCSIEHFENVPKMLFLSLERACMTGRYENEIAKKLVFRKFSNIRLSDSRDLTVGSTEILGSSRPRRAVSESFGTLCWISVL